MLRYLNLPDIPEEIIKNLNYNFDEYRMRFTYKNYNWSDSFNKELDEWCKEHICDSIYWAWQIMFGDVVIHRDKGNNTKFSYIIDPGGTNVITDFYTDVVPDGGDPYKCRPFVTDSYVIESRKWHIMKTDIPHSVRNLDPGRVRFSVTGRIFPLTDLKFNQ